MNIFKKRPTRQTGLSETSLEHSNRNLYWAFGLVAGSWMICLLISGVIWTVNRGQIITSPQPEKFQETVAKFASETEFRAYISARSTSNYYPRDLMFEDSAPRALGSSPAELPQNLQSPERVSTTNVQVIGIDEPDIVKTNGTHLFVSDEQYGYTREVMDTVRPTREMIAPPWPQPISTTQILTAYPVDKISTTGNVSAYGELLVSDDRLVVLQGNTVVGYDISNPQSPQEVWKHELADNRRLNTARLYNNTLLLVSTQSIYQSIPCPLPLFKSGTENMIACTDIYHPVTPVDADSTYTITALSPETGAVNNQVSFVGSSASSVLYVSPTSVYVTFTKLENYSVLQARFLLESTLINEPTKEKIRATLSLPISKEAQQVEINHVIQQYAYSMSDDERMKWETTRTNQFASYVDDHKREVETTVISRVPLDSFTVAATGSVPGHPLNQFSLDEYDRHLRIATTIGGRNVGGGAESTNDVYVLNDKLSITGKAVDLGKQERIYAVRFTGPRGYVVTFKETDPLYALDLSNPSSPQTTGELKIPGFSSYLHPLTNDLLVGIGKEGSQVKVSLFNISNPTQPSEVDTYLLSDYWSSVLTTHHAFLHDPDQKIFFIPAERGGYIFSYSPEGLELTKTIEAPGIKRAVYIDKNLYLVGNHKLWVIDETNFETQRVFEW